MGAFIIKKVATILKDNVDLEKSWPPIYFDIILHYAFK